MVVHTPKPTIKTYSYGTIYPYGTVWVVVKIGVPFGVPIIIRHLLFRVPKRDPNFDNHPYMKAPIQQGRRLQQPCVFESSGPRRRGHQDHLRATAPLGGDFKAFEKY